jgi:hypothetical protein
MPKLLPTSFGSLDVVGLYALCAADRSEIVVMNLILRTHSEQNRLLIINY